MYFHKTQKTRKNMPSQIQSLHLKEQIKLNKKLKPNKNKSNSVRFDKKIDKFENTKNTSKDKSNNDKFDFSECAKNFAKGVLSPLTAVIKHPIATIATIATTAVACTVVPVLGPIMAVGFGALSVFQLSKGVVDIIKNIKNKNYDKAEKSFSEVGQGTIGIALTLLGSKQNAKVAKETKLMSELDIASLSNTQKTQIAKEVKNMSKLDAFKETMSLFTSKSGLKALKTQFKPSNMIARSKEALKFLFTKKEITKVKKEKMEFYKTEEGKRRSAMSMEEIEAEVKSLYKEAFDEYNIPEELRPDIKVVLKTNDPFYGGGYRSDCHQIEINAESYRQGVFDLPDLIKHESNHASKAILRQRLPQEEKEKLLIEFLLDRIQNGDKKEVLTGKRDLFGITGYEKIKTPKMNSQMKTNFSKLAQEKLYNLTSYTDDDFIQMVKPLVESNPDFAKQYNSIEEAATTLGKYAQNHHFRYNLGMNYSSGFNTAKVDIGLLKELTPEEKIAAIESFKESVDCLESNLGMQGGFFGFNADFEQYQFTPEEVASQQKGNNFEIQKLNEQLKELKSKPNYDLAKEARLLDEIEKSELTIKYKNLGREMYKLKIESNNHPENMELLAQVESMQGELKNLECDIEKLRGGKVASLRGMDYTTYQTKVRPEMGMSRSYPFATSDAVDILEDNITEES